MLYEVITMIMPVMDGQKAIETIRSFDAEMKIIASSGFVKDAENNRLESFNLSGFLVITSYSIHYTKLYDSAAPA